MILGLILPPVTPGRATLYAWLVWGMSWGIAAAWSRRTVERPTGVGGWAYYIPTFLGAWLLFGPEIVVRLRSSEGWPGLRLWPLAPAAGWLLCAATVASFAFAWWARLYLGSLWSGTITVKEGHRVVDTGPYRLVRHPIYTAIIAAGFIMAVELATPAALFGAALLTFGWWMKAREEERLLGQALGPAYDAYRRRTPMLVPFWVGRG